MIQLKNNTEIIICPFCLGHKKVKSFEQWGPVKQHTETTCAACGGQGMMEQITTIIIKALPPEMAKN